MHKDVQLNGITKTVVYIKVMQKYVKCQNCIIFSVLKVHADFCRLYSRKITIVDFKGKKESCKAFKLVIFL